MLKVTLDLAKALTYCPASCGIGPLSLKMYMPELVQPSPEPSEPINIQLSNGDAMQFMIHQGNGKTVLTAMDSLSSNCPDGTSVDFLPEILAKLAEQKIQFTALQFPHAFMVKGRFSATAYRAHFNHILIYKDASEQLIASIIDSTNNPVGISNPLPGLGWLMSNSLISGEELLQVKLIRLLSKPEAIDSLRACCTLQEDAQVMMTDPVFTSMQPSSGDKRCSIYALNTMTTLINYFTSARAAKSEDIKRIATEAHQELNEPEMMAISFPSSYRVG